MRSGKKIAAANWKMNCTYPEAIALATAIMNSEIVSKAKAEVILAAPFIYLDALVKMAGKHSNIKIAAQNCSSEKEGAYTGEVSAQMLASLNVNTVIIGHSERRIIFKEDNETLRRKIDRALENKMQPVFCCGERIEYRDLFKHFNVIEEQLWQSLFHIDEEDISKCIIAYEPVWAIGTGITATPEQVQEMHRYIRGLITEKYSGEIANGISILYGGSCNENNAGQLFALEDVDGGLIGGASLKAESFIKIINSF